MTDLRARGDTTKNRLLEATENLIAEKGFDAVSVRDITGLAKANVAAVNYHFSSREGLLAAVLEHRMKPLAEERTKNLNVLSEDHGVREYLQAWVSPLVSLMGVSGLPESSYCRVMGRCMEVLASSAFPEATKNTRTVDVLLQDILEKCLPSMVSQEIAWRFHFATGALIHMLVHGASLQGHFRLSLAVAHWVESTALSFHASDALQERSQAVEKTNTTRPKARSTPQMRQVAEVVSAVMEADEGHVDAGMLNKHSTALNGEMQNQSPNENTAAKHKKSKGDDGCGELFLF